MEKPYLNFIREGSGQPLLIIHGLFGSSRNWKSLSKEFAARFDVITVDLRNHGDSFHDQLMDYSTMAYDVYRLLVHLDISTCHVIGHSMGGKTAMQLCRSHPEIIQTMIVADIAPVTYSHDHHQLVDAMLALDLEQVSSRKIADQLLLDAIPDQRIRLFLLQNLGFDQGKAVWNINWKAIKDSMEQLIGFEDISEWQIDNPTLFLYGELSDYVTDHHWQLIQQHFNQVQRQVIHNAGHWLHAEQPSAFAEAVMNYLQKAGLTES